MINQLQKSPFTTRLFKSPPPAPGNPNEEGHKAPADGVQLSQAAKDVPTGADKKSESFFSGGLAKTAMMVGLVASVGMGMAGCTTMQTSCGPMGCVTTEVIDPVGTAIAVGAGAVILDNALDNAHHHNHYHNYNYNYNYSEHGHGYGNYGYGQSGYGYGYEYGYGSGYGYGW